LEAFCSSALTTTCDDEIDPLVQDGKYPFDTSSFEATIEWTNRNDYNFILYESTSSNFTTGTQKCVGNSNESIKSILSCDLITLN
jgi:hypothetical protein